MLIIQGNRTVRKKWCYLSYHQQPTRPPVFFFLPFF
uniref:Translation initiation factor eIF-2B subunit epsilon n=1 Tax=Rhizophora mucronata TaxID=61149 RepID=A0A2P2KMI2_RHIMU